VIDPAEERLRTGLAERGVDVTVPNVARIYDYLLGGKDNFEADRTAAERLCRLWPHSRNVCLQNRAFLGRVVQSLAQGRKLPGGRGIRQFLDIGSGLPTADSVHQIARRVIPQARVVYADYDPVVVLHSKVLLEEDSPDVLAVLADLRDPESLLRDERVRGLLDFREPVAVLMFAILHFLPDSEQPYEIVRRFTEALPAGSVLALSHITGEEVAPETQDAAIRVYEGASAPVCPRSREQIAAFFDGLDMAAPGLVNINLWPEQKSDFADRIPLALYGGIGVKP
jgi:hypothetical protein